jgi:hypothetical protein
MIGGDHPEIKPESWNRSRPARSLRDAWISGHGRLIPPMANEEKDRHVLASARCTQPPAIGATCVNSSIL